MALNGPAVLISGVDTGYAFLWGMVPSAFIISSVANFVSPIRCPPILWSLWRVMTTIEDERFLVCKWPLGLCAVFNAQWRRYTCCGHATCADWWVFCMTFGFPATFQLFGLYFLNFLPLSFLPLLFPISLFITSSPFLSACFCDCSDSAPAIFLFQFVLYFFEVCSSFPFPFSFSW